MQHAVIVLILYIVLAVISSPTLTGNAQYFTNLSNFTEHLHHFMLVDSIL